MIFLMLKLLYTPGVLQISSNSDYQWIFGGLKFSFPGFFWVGKFGTYFVGLIEVGSFFLGGGGGVQNNLVP